MWRLDLARKSREQTAESMKKTREAIQNELEEFLESGKKIQKVARGATGQDEKNRSKHIVISRKSRLNVR